MNPKFFVQSLPTKNSLEFGPWAELPKQKVSLSLSLTGSSRRAVHVPVIRI